MRTLGAALLAALLVTGASFGDDEPQTASPAVAAECSQLAERIPGLRLEQCRSAGLVASSATSTRGRPLLQRDFGPANGERPTRRVLMLGGIHGDEASAVVVAFQWIEWLKADRFQHYRWRVLPCANPDGLMSQPSQRTNANGVDLNRNFPAPDWRTQALNYWRTKAGADPRRYPGPREASEPETRWLIDEIREFKPDTIVSVHAPLNVLDFDGP